MDLPPSTYLCIDMKLINLSTLCVNWLYTRYVYLWPQAETIVFKGVVDGFQVGNIYFLRSES